MRVFGIKTAYNEKPFCVFVDIKGIIYTWYPRKYPQSSQLCRTGKQELVRIDKNKISLKVLKILIELQHNIKCQNKLKQVKKP